MYVSEGIVYGGEPEKPLKISSLKILPDRIMLLTFLGGEVRLFDASILDGEVFEPLKDDAVFENAVLDHGVVTWMDGAIDCAPEYMYENSYEYQGVVSL